MNLLLDQDPLKQDVEFNLHLGWLCPPPRLDDLHSLLPLGDGRQLIISVNNQKVIVHLWHGIGGPQCRSLPYGAV